jgi:GAF domain-containing protein
MSMDLAGVELAKLSGEMFDTYQRELTTAINDPERLRAVYGSTFFDADRQQQIESVCAAAAQLLEADRGSVVMIVEDEAIVIASTRAGEAVAHPVKQSYCQNLVKTGEPLCISDSTTHALVCMTEASMVGGVRSYLGVPLVRHGQIIGALCVWCYRDRSWNSAEVSVLTSFAAALMRFEAT